MLSFSLLFLLLLRLTESCKYEDLDDKDSEKNCTFGRKIVNSQNLEYFPSQCETVCGDLKIDKSCDLSEDQLTEAFKNMKKLIGSLAVEYTNFTSARFLAGLESFEVGQSGSLEFNYNPNMIELGLLNLSNVNAPGVYIYFMPNLKRLNLPALEIAESMRVYTNPWVKFRYKPVSNSCLGLEILEDLMNFKGAELDSIDGDYCKPTPDENACNEPGEGCRRIFGDVYIDANFDLSRMKSTQTIIGNLIINGTSIQNMTFLENLQWIVPFEWTRRTSFSSYSIENQFKFRYKEPAIYVVNNRNLVNITFPKLKRVHSHSDQPIFFENNTDQISYDYESCLKLYATMDIPSKMLIDYRSCVELRNFANIRKSEQEKWFGILGGCLIVIVLACLLTCCRQKLKKACCGSRQ